MRNGNAGCLVVFNKAGVSMNKSVAVIRSRLGLSFVGAPTRCCVSILFFSLGMTCFSQGTLHFTFDGPPTIQPGSAAFVQQYYESSMWFRPLGVVGPGNGFVRQGGAYFPYPENGSVYIQTALGNSLTFSFLDSSVFGLMSADLAEYSTTIPGAVTVPFVGYRQDGSTVTTSFTTDGVIDGTGPVADFQTFYFGPEFSNLTRVEIPTFGWSLDNLRLSVPEPSAGMLMILGVAILCLRFRKK